MLGSIWGPYWAYDLAVLWLTFRASTLCISKVVIVSRLKYWHLRGVQKSANFTYGDLMLTRQHDETQEVAGCSVDLVFPPSNPIKPLRQAP